VLREDRYKKKMLLGQDGNALVWLLAIIAIAFCLLKFLWLVYQLSSWKESEYYTNVFNWFTIPANPALFINRPWTILTYMFVHDDPMILLGNVLWLWAFGYILQDLAGPKKVIPLFVYGGVAGGVAFILLHLAFPSLTIKDGNASLIGASAGLMAIAIGITMKAPKYRLFPMINGGIPLWILTVIYVLLSLALEPVNHAGGAGKLLALIAGAGVGFLFMLQLRKGRDWSTWMNNFFDWISNLFNPDKNSWKKTAKDELHYSSDGPQPYKKIANITQKRIDEILDKINQQGYRYLTEEEKEILRRAAEDEEL
jgi:membrane associated rhomboid family serine protease